MDKVNNLTAAPQEFNQQQLEVNEELKKLNEEIQALCYEIFHVSENGKRLYELWLQTIIIPTMVDVIKTPPDQYLLMLNHAEGIKNAYRSVYENGKAHILRMNGVKQ